MNASRRKRIKEINEWFEKKGYETEAFAARSLRCDDGLSLTELSDGNDITDDFVELFESGYMAHCKKRRMQMTDYIDKIKKLLALSKSPVQAEAEAALLKARELMVKYKIEQSDLDNNEHHNEELKSEIIYDIRFFSRKDLWLNNILCLIDKYYPVEISILNPTGLKSHYPVVSGFSSDVEVVIQLIGYIYDSVYSFTKDYCRKEKICPGRVQSKIRDSYGFGFCEGWKKALEKQNEQNPEWALVLAKPDVSSVADISGFYRPNVPGYSVYSYDAHKQGRDDGYSFGSQKRIESN